MPRKSESEVEPVSARLSRVPTHVFAETNALYPLKAEWNHVEFQRLLGLIRVLQCELAVPEVCWLEYLRIRKNEIAATISQLKAARQQSKFYGGNVSVFDDAIVATEQLRKNTSKFFQSRAEEKGVVIVPTASPQISELLTMSIDNVPPFEESNEKGFRDALAIFTIIHHLEKSSGSVALIVSGDKLFRKGILRTGKANAIHFADDLKDAADQLQQQLDAAQQAKLQKEKEAAIALLTKSKAAIEAELARLVKEAEERDSTGSTHIAPLSSGAFWGQSIATPWIRSSFDLRDYEALEMSQIEDASWQDRDDKNSRISFSIVAVGTPRMMHGLPNVYNISLLNTTKAGSTGSLTYSNLYPGATYPAPSEYLRFNGVAEVERREGSEKLTSLRLDPPPMYMPTLITWPSPDW